jgi:lipopolysaccharide transport system ATP-binding protein
MVRIDCQAVTKRFHLHAGPRLLRSHVVNSLRRRQRDWFYALKNVSFRVSSGESIAIVGRNGAGKSTLLSLITGLTRPDVGEITTAGKIAALLELGSGFHFDLTGAENLRLNAALLGFTRKQTNMLFDSIVEFAEIGDFINEPLRTFSSGMVLRLAFSVAVNLDPDILIVDEIIAVGDQAFQAKCFDRVRQFRDRGKTIVAVSHATGILLELCDRALYLDQGELVADGEIGSVLDTYAGMARSATS